MKYCCPLFDIRDQLTSLEITFIKNYQFVIFENPNCIREVSRRIKCLFPLCIIYFFINLSFCFVSYKFYISIAGNSSVNINRKKVK